MYLINILQTGEKPCICPICGRGFGQSSTLRGHLKWHAKPKTEKQPRKKKKKLQNVDMFIQLPVSSLIHASTSYLG